MFFILPSFGLLQLSDTAHIAVVADEASCAVLLPEPSEEEESSPLSTSIGLPTDGYYQPRDID